MQGCYGIVAESERKAENTAKQPATMSQPRGDKGLKLHIKFDESRTEICCNLQVVGHHGFVGAHRTC